MKTTCFDPPVAAVVACPVLTCRTVVCTLSQMSVITSKSPDFLFHIDVRGRRPTAAAKQSSSATRQNAKRERAEESVDSRAADGRVGRALRSRGGRHFFALPQRRCRIKANDGELHHTHP